MVGFAVAGEQFHVHGFVDFGKMLLQPRQCSGIKYLAPIFRNADQMDGEPGKPR